jgi:hypothetical protein
VQQQNILRLQVADFATFREPLLAAFKTFYPTINQSASVASAVNFSDFPVTS